MSCCLSRCFQQSNVSQNVVYSQNNMFLTAKLVIFLCSVISQGKVVALDRWGGKWNHLSMTHRLTSIYAKNYCNRTPIVKVIIENVVTCFFWGHSVFEHCFILFGASPPASMPTLIVPYTFLYYYYYITIILLLLLLRYLLNANGR